MLIIRKLAVSAITYSLVIAPTAAPAYGIGVVQKPMKMSVITTVAAKELPVTVELTHLTVRTTRTQASRSIASRESLYFDAEALAFLTVYSKGWSVKEWGCLRSVWRHESNFNPKSLNKKSGAYGIPQFMPDTWDNYKVKKTSNAQLQIKYGMRYIEKRYGSACNAWKFWRTHQWY
jgi:hypothetical protein